MLLAIYSLIESGYGDYPNSVQLRTKFYETRACPVVNFLETCTFLPEHLDNRSRFLCLMVFRAPPLSTITQ